MKRLVFGTCYSATIERRETVTLWGRLMRRLAGDADIAIIDSNSPCKPRDWMFNHPRIVAFDLKDNIGHLGIAGGGDGWGRAFSDGFRRAVKQGYDQVACIDTDILFARPLEPIFDRIKTAGVKCAAPMDTSYWFIESGIMFFDVPWLKSSQFVEKYDWENPPPLKPGTNPERRCELAAGDDLFILPLRGLRNDFGKLSPADIDRAHFPYGLDYLTHLGNFSLAWKFLEFNGLDDV